MADVDETALVDHGSHNVDIPIKGHLQETGQPRGGRTQNEESERAEDQGRSDSRRSRVLGKRTCNHRGRNSGRVPRGGSKETEAAGWEKEQ